MAVDSRAKRQSAHRAANTWGRILPNPDGTVARADRQHVLGYYGGIAVAVILAARSQIASVLHRNELSDVLHRTEGSDVIHRNEIIEI